MAQRSRLSFLESFLFRETSVIAKTRWLSLLDQKRGSSELRIRFRHRAYLSTTADIDFHEPKVVFPSVNFFVLTFLRNFPLRYVPRIETTSRPLPRFFPKYTFVPLHAKLPRNSSPCSGERLTHVRCVTAQCAHTHMCVHIPSVLSCNYRSRV